MSETAPHQQNGEDQHETWIPFRLLNDSPREHRFDMTSEDIPNEIVNIVDGMSVDIFDPNSGNAIVIGSERSGKTFLVEQLIGNQEKYSDTEHYFIEVREVDLGGILGLTDTFTTFADLAAQELEVDADLIVYVTGNSDVATTFASSGSPRKMIFEAQIGAYQRIMTDESTYENGAWSNWSAFDANEISLTERQLVDMLYQTQLETNHNAPSRSQIQLLIKKILQRRPSIRKTSGKISAPPGIFAVILRRAAGLMKHTKSKNFQTAKGNPSWSKITHGVIEEFIDFFDPFTSEGYHDALGEQIHNLVNDLMNGDSTGGNTPSQIIISSGMSPEQLTETQTEKQEDTGRDGIQWSDMTTLADRMNAKVHGQEETIEQIVRDLSVAATGLSDANKPLGTFMLMGPTGVGKTMIANTLAQELLQEDMNMLRLDMSEYSRHFEAAKLFGVPPGYVGFDEGGILTNAIQKNPRTLILLDEAEKADKLVWNSFLQVFDAGRMTTATGEVVDFSQTVIIMTSNLGTREMSRGTSGFTPMGKANGGDNRNRHAIAMSEAKKYFRQEMLGRMDAILTVNPLGKDTARKIMHEELQKVFTRSGMTMEPVADNVIDRLLQKSNVEEFGAREVQHTVRKEIAVKLSSAILQNPKKNKKASKVFTIALNDDGDILLK